MEDKQLAKDKQHSQFGVMFLFNASVSNEWVALKRFVKPFIIFDHSGQKVGWQTTILLFELRKRNQNIS